MLPRAPRAIDTTTLAARLDGEHGFIVPPRTLQRELLALTGIFPIVVDDSKKPYRWSWEQRAPSLTLPLVDPRSALLVMLVERHLRDALPPALRESMEPIVESARQALTTEKSKLGAWLRSVRVIPRHLPLHPPPQAPDVFAAVAEALLAQRKVEVLYQGRRPGERTHVISPLGLVLKDGIGYLLGVVDGKEDVVTFALHRARAAKVLPDRRQAPKDFDLDKRIESGAFGFLIQDRIDLKVRFSNTVAITVRESRVDADQQVLDDGDNHVVLHASVPDTQQLRSWLLGFGAEAEVLAPPSLREWAAATARSLAALYPDGH